MKKITSIILLFIVTFFLCSCDNGVDRKNFKKITYNMSLQEVVDILGDYDEIFIMKPNPFNNCYFWFSKGETLEEAKELVKKGEKIYFIEVITDNKTKVIGKLDGSVFDKLQPGEVSLYA